MSFMDPLKHMKKRWADFLPNLQNKHSNLKFKLRKIKIEIKNKSKPVAPLNKGANLEDVENKVLEVEADEKENFLVREILKVTLTLNALFVKINNNKIRT